MVASAPAITNLLLISSTAQSRASESPTPLKRQPAAGNVVFKINGWDRQCENEAKDDQVWIRIDQSWRTAWR